MPYHEEYTEEVQQTVESSFVETTKLNKTFVLSCIVHLSEHRLHWILQQRSSNCSRQSSAVEQGLEVPTNNVFDDVLVFFIKLEKGMDHQYCCCCVVVDVIFALKQELCSL